MWETLSQASPRFFCSARPEDCVHGHLIEAGCRLVPVRSESAVVFYEVQKPTAGDSDLPAVLF